MIAGRPSYMLQGLLSLLLCVCNAQDGEIPLAARMAHAGQENPVTGGAATSGQPGPQPLDPFATALGGTRQAGTDADSLYQHWRPDLAGLGPAARSQALLRNQGTRLQGTSPHGPRKTALQGPSQAPDPQVSREPSQELGPVGPQPQELGRQGQRPHPQASNRLHQWSQALGRHGQRAWGAIGRGPLGRTQAQAQLSSSSSPPPQGSQRQRPSKEERAKLLAKFLGASEKAAQAHDLGHEVHPERARSLNAITAARVERTRPCKTDSPDASASSASLRVPTASAGPGPEGMFPVPTVIGMCCQRSSSTSLYKYLERLAAAQGAPKDNAPYDDKELEFFTKSVPRLWAGTPAARKRAAELQGVAAAPAAAGVVRGTAGDGQGSNGGRRPAEVAVDGYEKPVDPHRIMSMVLGGKFQLPWSRQGKPNSPNFMYKAYAGRWLKHWQGSGGSGSGTNAAAGGLVAAPGALPPKPSALFCVSSLVAPTVPPGKLPLDLQGGFPGQSTSPDGFPVASQDGGGSSGNSLFSPLPVARAGGPSDPFFAGTGVTQPASLFGGRVPVGLPFGMRRQREPVTDDFGARDQLYGAYLTFEFTPNYTYELDAPWVMASMMPDPRAPVLVLILRDPIERAIHGWFPKKRSPKGADVDLPIDFEWELETVIRRCFPRNYAVAKGGSATPGVGSNSPSSSPAGWAAGPAESLPPETPGQLPDPATCNAYGYDWQNQKHAVDCVLEQRTFHPPDATKSNSSVNLGLYDRWLVRGLYGLQIRNLLCAGFVPQQIVVATLTELAADPGAVLLLIAKAVEARGGRGGPEKGGFLVDKGFFNSKKLLQDEMHVVTGLVEKPDVTLPEPLSTQLKNMFGSDLRDLLALVTRENGFWVDEKMLAAEFEEILK